MEEAGQAVPNFKGAVVLHRSTTKFCQVSKLSDLQFAGDNLTENVNQVNSISIFRVCKFNVIDTFGTYQMIILAFSSACAIIKFKIWWRQHLSAFLAQPNKASQPSVYDI